MSICSAHRAPAERFDRRHQRPRVGRPRVEQPERHIRAGLRERDRAPAPDAASRAGDERGAAGEIEARRGGIAESGPIGRLIPCRQGATLASSFSPPPRLRGGEGRGEEVRRKRDARPLRTSSPKPSPPHRRGGEGFRIARAALSTATGSEPRTAAGPRRPRCPACRRRRPGDSGPSASAERPASRSPRPPVAKQAQLVDASHASNVPASA